MVNVLCRYYALLNRCRKYHELVKNVYIAPILAVTDEPHLECLPPLIVKDEVTNIDGVVPNV